MNELVEWIGVAGQAVISVELALGSVLLVRVLRATRDNSAISRAESYGKGFRHGIWTGTDPDHATELIEADTARENGTRSPKLR